MLLLATFSIVSLWKLYLFLMQRAALNVTRHNDLDPRLRMRMLPVVYSITGWPTVIFQWVLLYLIWDGIGLYNAVLAFAVYTAATMFVPVPFGHFFPIFRRVLSTRGDGEALALIQALDHTTGAVGG